MNSILDQNSGQGISLTSFILSNLKEASKWARFLGILGFIFSGLFLLTGIVMGGAFGSMAALSQNSGSLPEFMGAGFFVGIYIFSAAMTFFPSLFMYSFGTKTKDGIQSNIISELEAGIKNLKRFFKFYGILTIVIIAGYILLFIGAMFTGIASAF
ncbi:hypothetical protein [Marinigracilibium pacificum]|uniref:Uncharacterized protein n=1 Tax=Marinigracilibium pacificum TaxID=2729599 RepID=A0A848J1G0_9BACT|nr:hypothetical protein [Marinigracilibium pacificum]NMM49646.1 hypothetical protein [Marinigracilibium pacificum]